MAHSVPEIEDVLSVLLALLAGLQLGADQVIRHAHGVTVS